MALHQQWGENDAPVTFASAEEAFSHAMALVHKGKKVDAVCHVLVLLRAARAGAK